MLKRLDLRGVAGTELADHLPRPTLGGEEPVDAVRAILTDVERRGDEAVRDYTARFDGVDLGPGDLVVPPEDLRRALDDIDGDLHAALEEAADAIRSFHTGQLVPEHHYERHGVRVR